MNNASTPTEFSVVMPTYNRLNILGRAMTALAAAGEAYGLPHEVLVVDDGSSDGTAEFFASGRYDRSSCGPVRYIRQENSGPATARNRGVRKARGRLILFLGDDILVSPGLLSMHAEAHRRRSDQGEVAVLGSTLWAPEMRRSPFLRFLLEGDQFGFKHIEDRENVPYNFFYTANVSLPRQTMLDAGLFDESFPHAAWEDVELSYRMTRNGLRIVYEPDALAHHLHPTSLASFCRRRELVGVDAVLFYRKHPGTEKMICFDWLAPPPAPWKVGLADRFQKMYAALEKRHFDFGPLWLWRIFFKRLSYYHYFKGVRKGFALERKQTSESGPEGLNA